jgi:hypothetical protein
VEAWAAEARRVAAAAASAAAQAVQAAAAATAAEHGAAADAARAVEDARTANMRLHPAGHGRGAPPAANVETVAAAARPKTAAGKHLVVETEPADDRGRTKTRGESQQPADDWTVFVAQLDEITGTERPGRKSRPNVDVRDASTRAGDRRTW